MTLFGTLSDKKKLPKSFGIAQLINRRMPKCNTVLQSENDLFEPEIQPNSHGNC